MMGQIETRETFAMQPMARRNHFGNDLCEVA